MRPAPPHQRGYRNLPHRLLQPVTEILGSHKQMPASSTQSAVAGIDDYQEGYRLLLGLLHWREFHDEGVQRLGQAVIHLHDRFD